jgi:type II secretory pathway pseudopilin PulG
MDGGHSHRGFTLIEVIIAIGLGIMIVLVAVSGLRVTAQTVSTANRLSMQNAILRTAIVAANEEMDFWDSFDSRTDPSQRPLRNMGQPFQPMDFKAANGNPPLDFTHKNASQWWNGHIWSSNNKRWGDYSIFGKDGLISDPLVPAERNWRHKILPYLTSGIGNYAAVEYLPANFVFGFYNNANPGVIPTAFGTPGVGPNHFKTQHRNRAQPSCKVELGHDSGYLLTSVSNASGHPSCHKAVYSNNGGSAFGGAFNVSKLTDWNLGPQVSFLTGQPSHWPVVTIRTRISYRFQDFTHESRISVLDPYTGESFNMRLKGLTTTLRGARRQRNLDSEDHDPRYPQ